MELKVDKNSPLPIYHQIAVQMKAAIESGDLVPKTRLPAEMEIAKTLGISPMTARQAYSRLVEDGLLYRRHGRGTFVSEASAAEPEPEAGFTKEGIDFGVLLFNLHAMLSAESCLAALGSGQAHAFGSELILGLEAACAKRNINLHILNANGKSLHDSQNAVVEELIKKRRMNGLLLAGTPLCKEDIAWLASLGMPLVSIDSDYGRPEIPSVLTDDQAFTAAAAKHLATQGISRILLVTGPISFGKGPSAIMRRGWRMRVGFMDAIASCGLSKLSCPHLESAQSIAACEEAVAKQLSGPAGKRPQAIIVDGDTLAIGASRALRSAGSCAGKIQILNFADSRNSLFPFAVKPIAQMDDEAVNILERTCRDIKSFGAKTIPVESFDTSMASGGAA